MNFENIFENIIPNKEETVKRFSGNLDLLEKFVRKFPQDENWLKLKNAAEADDWSQMEMIAHTLKGYAGNMGFSKLYEACTGIVKGIREKDLDKAKACMPAALNAGQEIEAFVAELA